MQQHGGVIYNGYPASTISEAGAARGGIHRLTTVVSRGILLDVARALGREVLEPGYPIMPGDLDAACELARVAVEPGDIVLVRTGQMVHLRPEQRDLVAYTYPSPGLTIETAEWFHAHDVAARRHGHRCPSRSTRASTRTPTFRSISSTW